MEKEGTLRIPREYLLEPGDLGELLYRGMEKKSGAGLTPVDVKDYGYEKKGRICSTSIYWPHPGDHKVIGLPINEVRWLRDNILPHPLRSKFFDSLNRRRKEFALKDTSHWLYLDSRLELASEFLAETYGFDRVILMEAGEYPMRDGMLWRYLALDESVVEVICTGVDSYAPVLQKALIEEELPADHIVLPLAPSRAQIPAAGPIRMSPRLFPLEIWRVAMLGFLSLWDEKIPERYGRSHPKLIKLMHQGRTVNQRNLKITDAIFLTAFLWHKGVLENHKWVFLNEDLYQFEGWELS